ncbi:Uu.00g109530.m01.CDS01 [Anthostomella pinea]|uniref:Uu.00g109530.m01.CDS01 n=1 Tax=Anthostomella pinea TaxID=933095 RepID=A0AAI8VER9_9PEZI|nr:Uu.00g109530.m01.CDS01 [Anthostomella pinea]
MTNGTSQAANAQGVPPTPSMTTKDMSLREKHGKGKRLSSYTYFIRRELLKMTPNRSTTKKNKAFADDSDDDFETHTKKRKLNIKKALKMSPVKDEDVKDPGMLPLQSGLHDLAMELLR